MKSLIQITFAIVIACGLLCFLPQTLEAASSLEEKTL